MKYLCKITLKNKRIKQLSIVIFLVYTMQSFAQTIPTNIQHLLDSLQEKTRYELNYKRLNSNVRINNVPMHRLFTDEIIAQAKEANIKLEWGMIYDEEMRNRLLDLMQNRYREDELDTLVNRYMNDASILYSTSIMASELCKFDTMTVFKQTLDKYFEDLKSKEVQIIYDHRHNYNVFNMLHLDTTQAYIQVFDSLKNIRRKNIINYYLYENSYELSFYATLCSYLCDERFIPVLIEALDNSKNYQKRKVLEALARMGVEPYYSDLLKEETLTKEEVESGVDIDSDFFLKVIRTQEGFLAYAEMLKSNRKCAIIPGYSKRSYGDELKFCVLEDIYYNLENKDMREYIAGGTTEWWRVVPNPLPLDWVEKVDWLYNWMQENYGKYEIRWDY